MYAGLFALMLVAAIITIPHAIAQESEHRSDKTRHAQKPVRQASVTGVGVGAAVDNNGNLHRSHYRIDLANSTASDTDYQVKNGQLFILEKGARGAYKLVPQTWKIDLSNNTSAFKATGQVKDEKNVYNVSLTGTKIRDVKNGSLYRVDGNLSGNSTEYDLHYISTFAKKNRSVESMHASK